MVSQKLHEKNQTHLIPWSDEVQWAQEDIG